MSNLDQLIETYKSILIAEKYIIHLKSQLESKEIILAELIGSMDANALELERPEKFNIIGLFSKTLVSESAQHEFTRQEYLLTLLDFKECKASIKLIEFELKIVQQKVDQKRDIRAQLDLALSTERTHITNDYPHIQKRLLEINEALADIINYKREIFEALEVANKVRNTINRMLRNLEQAKKYDNWGSFYVEQLQGKKLQAAYMDKALQDSHQVSQQMKYLKKEMNDIFQFKPKSAMSTLEELIYFQDHFHESLLTDWIVKNDVHISLASVSGSKEYLRRIISSLNIYLDKSESKFMQLRESKEYLIANI